MIGIAEIAFAKEISYYDFIDFTNVWFKHRSCFKSQS